MTAALNYLTNLLKSQYRWAKMSDAERYLSQASDTADLERRMKELRRPLNTENYKIRYWI